MEVLNANIKYLYILLIVALVIVSIVLIINLIKISKTINEKADKLDNINGNIEAAQNKTETIEETKESWMFFGKIAAILTVSKAIVKDYKETPKRKRSLSKSIAKKTIVKYSSIKRIIK